MKRRTCLKAMFAGASAAVAAGQHKGRPIQLHVDLSVDPAKEKEMLHNFHTVFRPAAAQQPGFIDVKMLKLRSAVVGTAPAGVNYRFELRFASEEQRKAWVATDTHQKVWPTIENTLSSKNYSVLLFDES
jgi:antibiotic biosynthesis monooxygenase (ABM) superfamily enzyme